MTATTGSTFLNELVPTSDSFGVTGFFGLLTVTHQLAADIVSAANGGFCSQGQHQKKTEDSQTRHGFGLERVMKGNNAYTRIPSTIRMAPLYTTPMETLFTHHASEWPCPCKQILTFYLGINLRRVHVHRFEDAEDSSPKEMRHLRYLFKGTSPLWQASLPVIWSPTTNHAKKPKAFNYVTEYCTCIVYKKTKNNQFYLLISKVQAFLRQRRLSGWHSKLSAQTAVGAPPFLVVSVQFSFSSKKLSI